MTAMDFLERRGREGGGCSFDDIAGENYFTLFYLFCRCCCCWVQLHMWGCMGGFLRSREDVCCLFWFLDANVVITRDMCRVAFDGFNLV